MISSSSSFARHLSLIVLACCLLHCGRRDALTLNGSDLKQFFQNSVRRDANSEEIHQVVRLPPECTAFFLASSSHRPFYGSAKHCVNYAPSTWCEQGGSILSNDGKSGKCLRIVASDETRDIFVFEASFNLGVAASFGLRLSAKPPAVGSQLSMVGYPVDKYRKGKLTVTENCWVLKTDVPSPYGGSINDLSARHNCTTYSGNSGGPMVLAGTFNVVGLPFSYVVNDYSLRDPENVETSAYMAEMSDFVTAHRSELQEAGIVIAE